MNNHINIQSLKNEYQRIYELPFDSDRKLMSVVVKKDNELFVITKGACDELIKRCHSGHLDNAIKITEELSQKALRVIAIAYKKINSFDESNVNQLESDLTLMGLVGMIDPPREEAKEAVAKCKTAGIKTVMITGDHKITAIAIAKSLGILQSEEEAKTGLELEEMTQEELTKNVRKYSVYARVSPEHKVRIVKAWQKNGEVVAMTGDGVNDSPALKTSDIGCAMGVVGTDVAKEAADVILTDDNFATIVEAVKEGR